MCGIGSCAWALPIIMGVWLYACCASSYRDRVGLEKDGLFSPRILKCIVSLFWFHILISNMIVSIEGGRIISLWKEGDN